jgi:hypothetical protein
MLVWAEIKGTKIQGTVVQKIRKGMNIIFALDVSGNGDIFYVQGRDVKIIPTEKR